MDTRLDFAQLASELASLPQGQNYPLESWNPQDCGKLPLFIDAQGQWWSIDNEHQKSAYRRPKLVHMLSKLLWCEVKNYTPGDPQPQYSLKTPHESVRITVEDVPFTIIDYTWHNIQGNSVMKCTTNLGESLFVNSQHPLCIHPESPYLPYVKVRHSLWARFNRNTYYQLINALLSQRTDEKKPLSIESHGHRFIISGSNYDNT